MQSLGLTILVPSKVLEGVSPKGTYFSMRIIDCYPDLLFVSLEICISLFVNKSFVQGQTIFYSDTDADAVAAGAAAGAAATVATTVKTMVKTKAAAPAVTASVSEEKIV